MRSICNSTTDNLPTWRSVLCFSCLPLFKACWHCVYTDDSPQPNKIHQQTSNCSKTSRSLFHTAAIFRAQYEIRFDTQCTFLFLYCLFQGENNSKLCCALQDDSACHSNWELNSSQVSFSSRSIWNEMRLKITVLHLKNIERNHGAYKKIGYSIMQY